ncbi:MAG: AAA family ATPase [Muribaculaceae bacterium]|nr:AAA family ATPase [Muribaculaceae bacterium]
MKYTFDSIAGYKIEKEELKRICEVLSNRDKYLKKGAKMPKGVIFYGEAGTGKTLFAKVLAEECGLVTYKIDIADLDNTAQICKKIKKSFEKAAKSKEPAMIFFDELDKLLPNAREEYFTDQSKMVLAQLLTLIDGMKSSNNFIFVATCNSYGALPETLVRPGRIDKKISIGKPTYKSRVEILKLYTSKSSCRFEISMEELADLCTGFTCSALETLVNECIIQSDENNFVSKELITTRILEVKQEDIPRKTSSISDTINACKNIGHFIVARSFNDGKYLLNLEPDNLGNNFFNKVLSDYDDSYEDDHYCDDDEDEEEDDFDIDLEDREIDEYVREHGNSIFYEEDDEDKYFCKTDLLNTICVILGGYAAEKIVFNKTYDNFYGDLTNIHSILINMAELYMFGIENAFSPWRNRELPYPYEFTGRLNSLFENTISECYKAAENIVVKNKTLIEKLIPILVEKRYMDNSVCEPIINELGGIQY